MAKRRRGSAATETSTTPYTEAATQTAAPMSDMTMDTTYSGAGTMGPANWVDPITYRKLRARFRKGYVRRGKKAPAKKRRTYRRSYRTTSRPLSGMGPIVITGRGGYWTDKLKSGATAAYRALQRGIPSGTFERLGTAAGGAMYGGTGAKLGGMAGSGIANVLGFGDYNIVRNDLLQLHEGMQVPSFNDLNQGIVVCHREWIADINPTTDFTVRSYNINPGLQGTFPWLSTLAQSFDQYEILGMLFQFRSTSSDTNAGAGIGQGTVIMTTEYDTADSPYKSKLEMENAQYSLSGKPSQDMIHAIECDPSLVGPAGVKYIRTASVPSGKDSRLYDHGIFQLATQGIPAAGPTDVIGELWCTYKIAFYKPQLSLNTQVMTTLDSWDQYTAANYWGVPASKESFADQSFPVTYSGNVATIGPNIPTDSIIQLTLTYTFASQLIGSGLLFALSGLTGLDQRQTPGPLTTTTFISVGIFRKTADVATITLSNLTVATGQSGNIAHWTVLDKDASFTRFNQT